MKFYELDPRSEAWQRARCGIPTASQFDRILTASKLEVSKQSEKYLYELLAEFVTGVPIEAMGLMGDEPERYQSSWMARGQDTEATIKKCYEAYSEQETLCGGFFTDDSGLVGASPDWRVGELGLVEAKSPGLTTQIGYGISSGLRGAHNLQVQGQLMVSEREWCDLFAYHPKLFIPPLRIYRDEPTIRIMRTAIDKFVETMLDCRRVLENKYGPFVRETQAPTSDNGNALGVTLEDVEEILRSQNS